MKKEHTNQHGISNEQKAQMLMSGWNNQMNAIWHIHQHIFIAQGATLAAWFLLYDKCYYTMSIGLTVLVNVLFLIGIFIVKRHQQINKEINQQLFNLGILTNPDFPLSLLGSLMKSKIGEMNNNELARLVIVVLIITNTILSIASACKLDYRICYSYFPSILLILMNLLIIGRIFFSWKDLIINEKSRIKPS